MTQPIRRVPGGLFLVLEGIGGAGKTDATASITMALMDEGYSVVQTKQPGATPLGAEIRRLLLGEEHRAENDATAQLFGYAWDRYIHLRGVVRPALAEGLVVLCDRYDYSTRAYQGIQEGDPAALEIVNNLATGGLRPDRCYLLDINPREAAKRIAGANRQEIDRFDLEGMRFQQNLRKQYLKQHVADGKRARAAGPGDHREILKVDASQPPAVVAERILRDIHKLIDRKLAA